jgi:hypothetical protein
MHNVICVGDCWILCLDSLHQYSQSLCAIFYVSHLVRFGVIIICCSQSGYNTEMLS